MPTHDFPLQGEFIELNVLLKLIALASSGGAAKAMISEGHVRVGKDNETMRVENRIRRKLRVGDVVQLGDQTIRILASQE